MRKSFYKTRRLFAPMGAAIVVIGICLTISGCKKFLEIPPPPDKIDKTVAFESDGTATAAITGIYSEMINNAQQFSSGFTTLYGGLAADELLYYTPGLLDEFSSNDISEQNHVNLTNYFWSKAYRFIYSSNVALEQLAVSTTLTPSVKNMLTGEAKFCRAFSYFYLVNLFGDVPLILKSDYRENSLVTRTSKVEVYNQIIDDLIDAKTKLSVPYPTTERGRPNKWAASALLARVYLYIGNWMAAESESTAVISSGNYSLTTLQNTFLRNSTETIWQLFAGNTSVGTWEAFYILPATASATPTYLITNNLFNAFENGDNRKTAWIATRTFANQTIRYPAKYKFYPATTTVTEAYIVLRYAEQLLIRAEARTQQGNINGAKTDLNIIRQRAGLSATLANDQSSLLQTIAKERQVELFAEWGHRWLDAKRNNLASTYFSYKPTWQATDILWPIPTDQINLNTSLTQNPGY
jgi:hypothetical protein